MHNQHKSQSKIPSLIKLLKFPKYSSITRVITRENYSCEVTGVGSTGQNCFRPCMVLVATKDLGNKASDMYDDKTI